MASLHREPNGRWRIQFPTQPDGKRPSIRLGRIPEKTARTFHSHVEHLHSAKSAGHPVDSETARWLANLPEFLHERVARAGLAPDRESLKPATLGPMLAAFFEGVDVKPSTRTRMEQAERALLSHFGEGRDAASISPADAEAWRADLRKRYAQATVSRTVLYARQMFRWAEQHGFVPANPFADVKAGPQVNASRAVFIDRATIAKVIDAAPDAEWRLLIALSRFGGLRVPSEAIALRWTDVDWEHNRLAVRSSKTEHHEGKGERIVPLFPEVRECLMEVFEAAPAGADYVIGRYREGSNLNPQLRRIIKRAGLTPWPRTWHNLRASRQTELASEYPLHTVCAWIGNTKAIAAGHYLQVTDADWERAVGSEGERSNDGAVQKAVQQPPATHASGRNEPSGGSPEPSKKHAVRGIADECASVQSHPMGRGGLEPPTPAFSVPCSTN
jgi:integrase